MEQVDMALEPVRAFLIQVGTFLPKLILAIVILIVGWLLAKFFRFAVVRGLQAINFHVLTEKAGIDGFLNQGGIKTGTAGILGLLIYWLAILITLVIAFNSLGLTYVTDLVSQVVLFIPKVIVAVLILAVGMYFSRFIAQVVSAYGKNVGMADAELLGRISQYAIMVFVVLIALDQVNVVSDIIRHAFLILFAGVVLALALAFGIGGQKSAADLLERWWPRDKGASGSKQSRE
jgi:Mechanosensitive ion channel, conserved TM helix